MIELIELFAGYGSQSLSLERLGVEYRLLATSEWNIQATESYIAIHKKGKEENKSNLTKEEKINYLNKLRLTRTDKTIIDFNKEKEIDKYYKEMKEMCNLGNIQGIKGKELGLRPRNNCLLTYSFPCTDLSSSGKRIGLYGERSGLLWEVERILKEIDECCLPKVLLMENVKGLVNKRNMPDFEKWIGILESLGYTNSYAVLNSSDYNVAQNRERCYMVSSLYGKTFKFPVKRPLERHLIDYLVEDTNTELRENLYQNVHIEDNPREFSNKLIVLGNYMPSNYEGSKVVSKYGIAPTVKENHSTVTGVVDRQGRVRKLCEREMGRLMGLTDSEIDKIQEIQGVTIQRKQFGNSIVVDVLESIMREIIEQGLIDR